MEIDVQVKLEDVQMLKKKLLSLHEPLKKIAIYLQSESQQAFERNTGRVTRWKDLSPATKKRKMREKGAIYPILVFNGKLRASIAHDVSKNTARIYSGVKEYAHFHQYGTRKMPARPFLEIDSGKDIPFIVKTLAESLRR